MTRIMPSAVLLTAGLLLWAIPLRASADSCNSLEPLKWMLGDWKSSGSGTVALESWREVSPDTFEGQTQFRSAEDGTVKSRESLRLLLMADEVFYLPKVAHNEFPVPFRLVECPGDSAVFENPEHDFPTRIEYRREHFDRISVLVSGPDEQGFRLDFERVPAPGARRIALSFDDAPRAGSGLFTGMERTERLLANLRAANSPAVLFFSTAAGIDEEGDARMRRYQEAGHLIGNHSYAHRGLEPGKADAFLADVRQAHEILSRYDNFVPLFRYPFLNEGRDRDSRDRVRAGLDRMGYRNGYVTVDSYDFYMDGLLQRALQQGREIDYGKLGEVWVETLVEAVRFYDRIARETLGRSPAHVLLLHENDLAARYVGDLVKALRMEGWRVIDALEAYDDPIADRRPDTLFNNQGRVAALAEAGGKARRELRHPAEDAAYLDRLFDERGVFGAPFPWSPYRADLLFSSNRDGNAEIYLLPAGADEWVNLSNHPAADNWPVWSPDGRQIAFQSRRNGEFDIFVMDADGANLRQLTDDPAHDYLPSWSPDGARIVFASWRTEPGDDEPANHLYIMNADGSGQRRFIAKSPGTSATAEWSPDGQTMALTLKEGETTDLFLADAGGAIMRQLTHDDFYNGTPVFAPEGDRLAFYTDYGAGSQIQVIAVDASWSRTLVAQGKNYYPRWSPDGCWLLWSAIVDPEEEADIDVRAMRVDGYGEWRTLVGGAGREAEASWRPQEVNPDLSCR